MSEIKIFICYKKILSQDGRLLHKNTEAEMLYYILKEDERYSPWMDTALTAGMRWEMEIYSQLLDSDVLIALIGPGTAQSEWVRREIALAKALGISVIPLGFSLTDEQMEEETKTYISMISNGYGRRVLASVVVSLCYWRSRSLSVERRSPLKGSSRRRLGAGRSGGSRTGRRRETIRRLRPFSSLIRTRLHHYMSRVATSSIFVGLTFLSTRKTTTCRWHASSNPVPSPQF